MSGDDRPGGFLLLPLGGLAREGKLAGWTDRSIAVLPAILAHENASTRLAWPSVARVAALAGVGKEAVRGAVDSLESGGWFSRVMRPGGGWAWHTYRARIRRDQAEANYA